MFEWPIVISSMEEPYIQKKYLPDLIISDKLQQQLDKSYAEFITEFYLCAKKQNSIANDSRDWFLSEIAKSLNVAYPQLSRRDILDIIYKIEKHGEDNA